MSLQSTYWMTSETDEVQCVYHMTFVAAMDFAKEHKCKTVEVHKLSKDAVPRLYNGGGGFVETSNVVWTNKDL